MKILPEHLNINSSLFGGITASLVDLVGSLAISAKNHSLYSSVHSGTSTDLSVTYLRPALEGDNLRYSKKIDFRIESECVKLGRNMAFSKVDLFVGDKLIAYGSHSKFMAEAQPDKKVKPSE